MSRVTNTEGSVPWDGTYIADKHIRVVRMWRQKRDDAVLRVRVCLYRYIPNQLAAPLHNSNVSYLDYERFPDETGHFSRSIVSIWSPPNQNPRLFNPERTSPT